MKEKNIKIMSGKRKKKYIGARQRQISPHKQNVQPTMVSHIEQDIEPADALLITEDRTVYTWLVFFCKHWWGLVVTVITIIFTNVVTQLQGSPNQLWRFLLQYPLLGIGVLLITIFSPLVLIQQRHKPAQPSIPQHKGPHQTNKGMLFSAFTTILIPTVLPALTTTLFIGLVFLVTLRPVWCPGVICPPLQVQAITESNGVHDANIDAYFTAFQSDYYMMPGNPQRYTLQNLPKTIAAVRSDQASARQAHAFRVALGVHDLRQSGYDIYIDNVLLLIKHVPPLATPLNVWTAGTLEYTSSPYSVTYSGEEPGVVIPTAYEPEPGVQHTHQHLYPGEADAIDIQINPTANLQADLQFQVQIMYSFADENRQYSLTLPNTFEVVFSNASNWHPFHIQGNHFQAN